MRRLLPFILILLFCVGCRPKPQKLGQRILQRGVGRYGKASTSKGRSGR